MSYLIDELKGNDMSPSEEATYVEMAKEIMFEYRRGLRGATFSVDNVEESLLGGTIGARRCK